MVSPRPTPPRSISPPAKSRRYFSQFRPSNSTVRGPPASAFPLSSITGNNVPRPIKRPKKILYLMGVFMLLYWFGMRHGLGAERIPHPLGFAVHGGRKRISSLLFDSSGMAIVRPPDSPFHNNDPHSATHHHEHPIYELMERAEERWHDLLDRQSTTLEQAVKQYKQRYTLDPPAGFDAWWNFVTKHNITIRDEYDQLMRDVLPHHALPPALWKKRATDLDGTEFTYTLKASKQQGVSLTGPRSTFARPKHMMNLVGGFLGDLPDGFELEMSVSDHDTGSQVLGKDQRERAMELMRTGQHFDEAEIKRLEDPNRTKAFGWFKACPMDSPANSRPKSEDYVHADGGRSFIADHMSTMDFCEFPEWKRLHGAMSTDYADRSRSYIKPIMVLSKFPMDASFQITPIEGYLNLTEADLEYEGVWEEKTDNRLFWRGSTTGGFNTQYRDWRDNHRVRMHVMVNGKKGVAGGGGAGGGEEWKEVEREIMLPDGKGGYVVKRRKEGMLSGAYAEVKLSGQAIQCSEALCKEINNEIQFGPRIAPDQTYAYKYALDVDGNGWSSRFHRLLSSASPVIKMTMFPEWHMEWLTPWYHYIPLKPDYSDLYDIMAFYAGPMDEQGKVDETLGHDHLARKIGEAGQRFALEHWSWHNMQAYTFRLLLELRRLHAPDRAAASFKMP